MIFISLIAWYPLTHDLRDYSGQNNHLNPISVTNGLSETPNGKLGNAWQRATVNNGNGYLRSKNDISLPNDFTMTCWAYVTGCHMGTANGIVSNHSHSHSRGAGITVRTIDSNDFRISCNAGTGSSRVFNAFFGTTNIKDKWAHLTLMFKKETNELSLWTNAVKEFQTTYNMAVGMDFLGIFLWSTTFTGSSSYRPACIINDVRCYDHVLSKKELQTLINAKVLHYRFADNDDRIIDSSGSNNHGDISTDSAPIWVSEAKVGKGAYSFQSSQRINLPSLIGNNQEVTACAWFKSNGSPGSGYHIIFGGAQLEISIPTSGQIRCGLHLNGTRRVDNHGSGLVDGNWHHVAMTYDGISKKAYIDGNLVGDVACSGNLTTSFVRTVGVYGSNSSYFTNGLIDDVRIYATALSALDIESIFRTRAIVDSSGNFSTHYIGNFQKVSAFPTPVGTSHNGTFGLRFTVSKPVVIRNALVRPYFSGKMSSTLYNFTTKELLKEVEFDVISGHVQRIDLNLYCKPGINYWLSPTGGNFMRSDAGVTFPFDDGVFNFTIGSNLSGSTASRWYYYFDIHYTYAEGLSKNGVINAVDFSEVGITDHLVAWYPFNLGFDDITSRRNHAISNKTDITNSPTGGGALFNGSDSTITIEEKDTDFSNDMSISFWLYINDYHGRTTLIDKSYGGEFTINIESGLSLRMYRGTGGINTTPYHRISTPPLSLGEWFFCVITVKGHDAKWYINKNLVSEESHERFDAVKTTANITLGKGYTSGFFDGVLSDLRFYEKALNDDEISILYDTTGSHNPQKMIKTSDHKYYIQGEFSELL